MPETCSIMGSIILFMSSLELRLIASFINSASCAPSVFIAKPNMSPEEKELKAFSEILPNALRAFSMRSCISLLSLLAEQIKSQTPSVAVPSRLITIERNSSKSLESMLAMLPAPSRASSGIIDISAQRLANDVLPSA